MRPPIHIPSPDMIDKKTIASYDTRCIVCDLRAWHLHEALPAPSVLTPCEHYCFTLRAVVVSGIDHYCSTGRPVVVRSPISSGPLADHYCSTHCHQALPTKSMGRIGATWLPMRPMGKEKESRNALGDYCIIRHSLRCLRHSGWVIYRRHSLRPQS